MNNADRLTKDAKILVDSVKDTFSANLMTAVRTKSIDLTQDQLARIINLFEISSNDGYQKASASYTKTVKRVLESVIPQQETKSLSKKK